MTFFCTFAPSALYSFFIIKLRAVCRFEKDSKWSPPLASATRHSYLYRSLCLPRRQPPLSPAPRSRHAALSYKQSARAVPVEPASAVRANWSRRTRRVRKPIRRNPADSPATSGKSRRSTRLTKRPGRSRGRLQGRQSRPEKEGAASVYLPRCYHLRRHHLGHQA